jgi:predicted RNA binding protein YcfA (HicA-like mRNA interferase family)
VRALERAGFRQVRQRGSHASLRHTDGRTATVPVHKGQTLGPGLLAKILRDVEMSREQLDELL